MELVRVSSGELRSIVVGAGGGALFTVPRLGRVVARGAGLAGGGVSCLRVLRRRDDMIVWNDCESLGDERRE